MPNIVIEWNCVYLNAIRNKEKDSPGGIARKGAMVHGAIYDAVNSIVKTHQPYLISIPAADGASIDAAAAQAAYQVLTRVYPEQTDSFDLSLQDSLDRISAADSVQNVESGRVIGTAAAYAMIAHRTNDGAENTDPYTPGTNAGDWRPTGSGNAVTPNWDKVRPFAMQTGNQFRPSRPAGYATKRDLLSSPEYAAQFNEVKRLGSATSSSRTAEETEIAFFWANDLDGTYKPPGQLFQFTQIVAQQRNLSIVETARLFALVGLALGDAGIVAWDAKYSTDLDLWRPETAVHLADMDGNPATDQDAAWEPLSVDRNGKHFSPAFPAYVSGHATFGATHAGIMRNFFGTDNVTFKLETEDPSAVNVKRAFNSFSSAALENGRSRVYLGVHYQWDADASYISGTQLADYVSANYLQAL